MSTALIKHTISKQILWRCSNFRPEVFGAVAFKFEPNMTVVIKYLSQKVGFLVCKKIVKCRSNQECRSICVDTVSTSTKNRSPLLPVSSTTNMVVVPIYNGQTL